MNLSKNANKKRRGIRYAIARVAAAGMATAALVACSDAEVVNTNMTKDAENFKIDRRITGINGITDKYLFTVEGKCNLEDQGTQLEVICFTGVDDDGNKLYKKTMLGISDNVTYIAEQIDPIAQDPYHFKVVLKPEAVLPDVEVRTSEGSVSTAP